MLSTKKYIYECKYTSEQLRCRGDELSSDLNLQVLEYTHGKQ